MKPSAAAGFASALKNALKQMAPQTAKQSESAEDDTKAPGPLEYSVADAPKSKREVSFEAKLIPSRKPPEPSQPEDQVIYSEISDLTPVCQRYRAIADYTKFDDSEMSFNAGEEMLVLEKGDSGWWLVELDGLEGWVPATYLELADQLYEEVGEPTPTPPPMPEKCTTSAKSPAFGANAKNRGPVEASKAGSKEDERDVNAAKETKKRPKTMQESVPRWSGDQYYEQPVFSSEEDLTAPSVQYNGNQHDVTEHGGVTATGSGSAGDSNAEFYGKAWLCGGRDNQVVDEDELYDVDPKKFGAKKTATADIPNTAASASSTKPFDLREELSKLRLSKTGGETGENNEATPQKLLKKVEPKTTVQDTQPQKPFKKVEPRKGVVHSKNDDAPSPFGQITLKPVAGNKVCGQKTDIPDEETKSVSDRAKMFGAGKPDKAAKAFSTERPRTPPKLAQTERPHTPPKPGAAVKPSRTPPKPASNQFQPQSQLKPATSETSRWSGGKPQATKLESAADEKPVDSSSEKPLKLSKPNGNLLPSDVIKRSRNPPGGRSDGTERISPKSHLVTGDKSQTTPSAAAVKSNQTSSQSDAKPSWAQHGLKPSAIAASSKPTTADVGSKASKATTASSSKPNKPKISNLAAMFETKPEKPAPSVVTKKAPASRDSGTDSELSAVLSKRRTQVDD